jgi:hypothetical protein
MSLIVKTAEDLAAEKEAAARAAEKAKAQAYLASTDWLIVRHAETGKDIPADVLDARANARELLSK